MIRHSRISWYIDTQGWFGGKQRTAYKIMSSRSSEALRKWLPTIVVEIMLLISFLLWLSGSNNEYHGLALVFAWTTYCLIATAILFFWAGPPERETDRTL